MPAQKRSHDASASDDDDNSPPPQPDHDLDLSEEQQPEDDNEDSDGSVSSGDIDMDEFVTVKLAELRKEVQCPICLGIIRKTRTVMECLHRFCRECIDKSMRLGNNECPACRTHCASRRSLRDDPNYDALIAVLYPDIDKYEAEELAFHEEEKARNKQIQASIAQTLRRQSEALGRKRTTARATAAAFVRRQGNYRNLRGRRNQRATEFIGSDNEDDNGGKDSSSTDEPSAEVKPKRYKRWGGARVSQCSLAASSVEGGGDENEPDVTREMVGGAAGLVGSSEMLGWGGGGMRSSTRHGSLSGGNGKCARNIRLSRLVDHLRHVQENEELDIELKLISLDEKAIPNLEQPYIHCSPTMSVKQLCQLIAIKTAVQEDEVEILLVKDVREKVEDKIPIIENNSFAPVDNIMPELVTVDPLKDELHVLKDHESLLGIQGLWDFSQHGLVLAYRKKLPGNVCS